ncbi:hypothetical protein SARC_00236 [Sphaeroforma arctica JP610]|uniref:J domain-containing protein n=1 Tax=Sphaeroforma arctica JP610 TaxID=667725 RepID=A0A0L0GF49_9EUKA|nr:hypothetical protein SARC_00236 [Sphaeroforma arctica JP610]KNC87665.1 hypothetical protein SARC_00236 [Sphaeroforma arctica JP610]|eukprot:XP_014161567.1 hypothetical protein SARC_00236 [Sphaeroforma arctica JP610]
MYALRNRAAQHDSFYRIRHTSMYFSRELKRGDPVFNSCTHRSMSTTRRKDSLYTIMGVSHSATQKEIKDRYRKLVVSLHPDKNLGKSDTTEQFAAINLAYETLGDETKRLIYNREYRIGTVARKSHHPGTSLFKPTRMESEKDLQRARDLHLQFLKKKAENAKYVEQLKVQRAHDVQGRWWLLSLFGILGSWWFFVTGSRRKKLNLAA